MEDCWAELILKIYKGPLPVTPVGWGWGEARSGVFVGVYWYASGPDPGPGFTALREMASTAFLQRAHGRGEVATVAQKVESSVVTGHTEEGTANSAWGVEDEEDFTNEKSCEVDFENQVGVFEMKKVGNKQVEI